MKRLLSVCTFVLSACLGVQAQTDPFQSIVSYIQQNMQFNASYPQEKVYLHFDNTGYFMGETIWFKAYVVRADQVRPTDLSKVLYVELVNPSGDVVETRKLQVNDGVAIGDIQLDSIYGTGFYEVRAYTRYMTNWGNGGIFSRVFPIFKKPQQDGDYAHMVMDEYNYKKRLPNLRDTSDDESDTDGRLRVRFYPEGGYLVKGVPCKVAFYATDKAGMVVDAGGALLNQKKEVLDAVNTVREGRGVFQFTPSDSAYYLRLADSKGRQHDFKLPEAEDEGVAMQLNVMKSDEVSALLYSTPALQKQLLGYTLMHDGRIYRADTVYAAPALELVFDRSEMPAGVNQLTVFTADGHIQSERLFFICPSSDDADSIRVTTPVAFPKPCGKIVLDIHAQPNAQLSLSAIDAATMVNGVEGNAKTYMLLSSELKGYISDPGYYFEADDAQHRMDADLLMMVQGWRRYDWSMMAGIPKEDEEEPRAATTSFLPPNSVGFSQPIEDQLYIFGQLREKKKKNTVDNVWLDVRLYNKDGYHFQGEAKTDSLGFYAFSMPDVSGEYKMLINTGKDNGKGVWKDVGYYVGIDRHFSPAKRLLTAQETTPLALMKPNLFHDEKSKKAAEEDHEYIPIQKREHVLPTVVVKAKRKRVFENARAAWASESTGQYYASLFYNADKDADAYADQGLEMPTVYEWLAKRNPFFGGTDMTGQLDEMMNDAATDETVFGDMGDTFSTTGTSDDPNEQADEMNEDAQKGNEEFESTAKQPRIYKNGLGYKNRPIVWMLDNDYAALSRFTGKIHDMETGWMVQRPTNQDLPIFLDEVKAVYVSESPDAFKGSLFCPDLSAYSPVTVFLYTHVSFPLLSKGMRSTHFQGYNKPSTFEMEDYSALPPMEDFRRTLYWAPDIKTDAQGRATVEFWNNSTCKEMFISCEGMTPDGRFMVNQ